MKKETHMKKTVIGLTVLLLVAGAFGARAEEKTFDQANPDYGVRSRLVETTATVKAIDQKQRLVTLESEEGETSTIEVDEAVKNLKQVKKGDQVSVKYYEALAWTLIKKKDRVEPTKSVSEETITAKPGEKPEGQKIRRTNLIATVEKIDKKTPSVTLRGPEGKVETVAVRDPKNLKNVKVGDQVDISYTEAMAISVEKAPKKY
jgi:Cu/Ag efflux protein CusF